MSSDHKHNSARTRHTCVCLLAGIVILVTAVLSLFVNAPVAAGRSNPLLHRVSHVLMAKKTWTPDEARQFADSVKKSGLDFALIMGAPDIVSGQLRQEIIFALRRRGLKAGDREVSGESNKLRGYVVAERHGSKVKFSHVWNAQNDVVGLIHFCYRQEYFPFDPVVHKDPWDALTPENIKHEADRFAQMIAQWVARHSREQ